MGFNCKMYVPLCAALFGHAELYLSAVSCDKQEADQELKRNKQHAGSSSWTINCRESCTSPECWQRGHSIGTAVPGEAETGFFFFNFLGSFFAFSAGTSTSICLSACSSSISSRTRLLLAESTTLIPCKSPRWLPEGFSQAAHHQADKSTSSSWPKRECTP